MLLDGNPEFDYQTVNERSENLIYICPICKAELFDFPFVVPDERFHCSECGLNFNSKDVLIKESFHYGLFE